MTCSLRSADGDAPDARTVRSVKPYFGMGVNSALQDVTILGECLSAADGDRDEEALNGALAAYSARHARDAKALVTMSKRHKNLKQDKR